MHISHFNREGSRIISKDEKGSRAKKFGKSCFRTLYLAARSALKKSFFTVSGARS